MKALVLLSGGMDSTAALYWARQEHEVVGAVSFDYGSKHNSKEIGFAIWHCGHLDIWHDTVALPFVNELFASDLLKSGGQVPDGHYAD
ncbi:MAG TPA: 7-cyano-7-deazaguanine synthase, partial [Prosthecobacter sp.]|nr:7-cyano-7-deazaguanine synthase [Prosthecobacter sp.]